MNCILNVQQLSKIYATANGTLTVLKDVTFRIQAQEVFAIVGPSGSGKTTLLGLCAGLDAPSSGTVVLDGIDLTVMKEEEKAKIRNRYIGFVFQNFQLLPSLTTMENVMAPMELKGEKNVKQKAMELLERVDLTARAQHYPAHLSGGEQQRVSLARAFANRPKILFADEPTGNLDGETGEKMVNLLFSLNREMGTTLALVTHDIPLAKRTDRILNIKNGILVSDEKVSGE
jgi:putative ABC transport system ATP-binding protein